MLTPKQYEAVGRLTLAFNEIEFAIEAYTSLLIHAPEFAVSEWIAEQGAFQNKADRLEGVLKAIASERPAVQSAADEIINQVRQARQIAERRNHYAHAMVVPDFEQNSTRLMRRGTHFHCDENELLFVADGASRLAFEIANTCEALYEQLLDLRAI